jgi:hypothetical protein
MDQKPSTPPSFLARLRAELQQELEHHQDALERARLRHVPDAAAVLLRMVANEIAHPRAKGRPVSASRLRLLHSMERHMLFALAVHCGHVVAARQLMSDGLVKALRKQEWVGSDDDCMLGYVSDDIIEQMSLFGPERLCECMATIYELKKEPGFDQKRETVQTDAAAAQQSAAGQGAGQKADCVEEQRCKARQDASEAEAGSAKGTILDFFAPDEAFGCFTG